MGSKGVGVKRGAKVVKVGVKQGVEDGRVLKGVKRRSASACQGVVHRDSASAKQRGDQGCSHTLDARRVGGFDPDLI